MGWDAYAVREDGVSAHRLIKLRADGRVVREFRNARKRTLEACRVRAGGNELWVGVDGMLREGGLDNSTCEQYLQRSLGIDTRGPEISLLELMIRQKQNRWDDVEDYMDPLNWWAFYSAREFIKSTIKLNMGVYFTW